MVDDGKGGSVSRPFYLALCGCVALAVAMGIGRFAFTPLLPLMQADAGLTLTGGSWLAFSNYLGYLLGALATVWLRAAPHAMVRGGLVATGGLTLAVGLVHGFAEWWVLRFASGVASAMVLVYASALTLEGLAMHGATRLFGFVFSGVGAGIALTGLACVALSATGLGSAAIWVAFGMAALVASAAVWPAFARVSEHGVAHAPQRRAADGGGTWDARAWTLIVAYGLYGFGYIIPGTFLPVIARDLLGGTVLSGAFWPLFGAAGFAGSLLAGRVGDAQLRFALVTCFLLEGLGVALPVVLPNAAGLAAGSLLLGVPFVAITMLTLREARLMADARHFAAAPLMGALTASFGLGQLAGPPFAGYMVAWLGGFGPALVVASLGLASGGIALWIMRR